MTQLVGDGEALGVFPQVFVDDDAACNFCFQLHAVVHAPPALPHLHLGDGGAPAAVLVLLHGVQVGQLRFIEEEIAVFGNFSNGNWEAGLGGRTVRRGGAGLRKKLVQHLLRTVKDGLDHIEIVEEAVPQLSVVFNQLLGLGAPELGKNGSVRINCRHEYPPI